MKSLSVDVSDGIGFFSGTVSDISRFGLCMDDLSRKLNENVRKMTIVVAGQGKRFKMSARPRWSTTEGHKRVLGAEILNPPWGWTEFVMAFEPVAHDEVWGTVKL